MDTSVDCSCCCINFCILQKIELGRADEMKKIESAVSILLIFFLVLPSFFVSYVYATDNSWEILSPIPTGSLEPGVAVVNKKSTLLEALIFFCAIIMKSMILLLIHGPQKRTCQ
jgi:hypothetical protein